MDLTQLTNSEKMVQVSVGWTVCLFIMGKSVVYPLRNNLRVSIVCFISFLSYQQVFTLSLFLFPSLPFRGCSSSETESEAGDLLDQQFEELNNKLNSVTDPTGFLRMVSRNNLFNR